MAKEDEPNFDHRALQAQMMPPANSPLPQMDGQVDPDVVELLRKQRHNGTDGERVLWTDIAQPLPAHAAAYIHVISGAKSFGPGSWSVAKSATGVYVVTHNMGNPNYAMFVTPITTKVYAVSTAKSTTATTISFFNDSGTATDSDFFMMIILVPFTV